MMEGHVVNLIMGRRKLHEKIVNSRIQIFDRIKMVRVFKYKKIYIFNNSSISWNRVPIEDVGKINFH